jgi:hypothetical protein
MPQTVKSDVQTTPPHWWTPCWRRQHLSRIRRSFRVIWRRTVVGGRSKPITSAQSRRLLRQRPVSFRRPPIQLEAGAEVYQMATY